MVKNDRDDKTLVMLTLAGDQNAYEALVRRWEKAAVASARSIIKSQYMAEDAAQDAFITAWMKLNCLNEPEKYGVWVCRIAKNCAKNMIVRFRDFLDLDVVANYDLSDDRYDPETLYLASEERKELHTSISQLSEKVQMVIKLHYFEGLSIADIADRMRVSVGTVKWQLHEGRKKLRKDLCAMNENMNDTLVRRVMKKVEELKAWQRMNSKNGFEEVYRDVLKDVEELSESKTKYSALADVLLCGWWWLAGEKNDALFARIKEAAELGANEEVMIFVCNQEDSKWYGSAGREFMKDKQIPYLQRLGMRRAEGVEWLNLANAYLTDDDHADIEKGKEALEKALSLLDPSDCHYAFAKSIAIREDWYGEYGKDVARKKIRVFAHMNLLKASDNGYLLMKDFCYGKGRLCGMDFDGECILQNAALHDGEFTIESLLPGEIHMASDGTVLRFVSKSEKVETPCGVFENCQVWETERDMDIYRSYYKDGVGIVKQVHESDVFTECRVLIDYYIQGGKGLLPMAKGNYWQYGIGNKEDVLLHKCIFTCYHADKDGATLGAVDLFLRYRNDETSWLDTINAIRSDYFDGEKVQDMTANMERAMALAKTSAEKAHTKAACSVCRRIMDTDPTFNPNYTAKGLWNFFERYVLSETDGEYRIRGDWRYSFELKSWAGDAMCPMLSNDIYDILQDGAGCIFSEKWQDGYRVTRKYLKYDDPLETELSVSNGGIVETAAGKFENCLHVSVNIKGLEHSSGREYRGGRREYDFAPGIGIVRVVGVYSGKGTCSSVYELAEYEGTGQGYMPFADGMMRRYTALGLTDGMEAGVTYTYAKNEKGGIVIFGDKLGIQQKPQIISSYNSIIGEIKEEEHWERGPEGHEDCRRQRYVNNFNILLHFLGRFDPYRAPESVQWRKFRMGLIEYLAQGGEIPPAWLGVYAEYHLGCAAAIFGCRKEEMWEEGYEMLEKALVLFAKWNEIPDGTALEIGNKAVFGGIKVIKGRSEIVFPDGTIEPMYGDANVEFEGNADSMYKALTSPYWLWFDSVREEARYKEYVKRALALMEKK
ncbi:MAG: sigma-70 family RNA polymerase sigma factor [Ruminococcaceae bacterium]|nr:sigma-70 family RNA polymerase sigma factor [Oscillospiraceae bacterium]